MTTISGIVITLNEEKNIKRCLDSLVFCDEIIVVDSGSVDKTLEIAKKYTSKIIFHKFESCTKQRLFSLSQASCQWILFIDADEVVTPELQKKLLHLKDDVQIGCVNIPRKNNFMGKWILNGGWYPDFQRRFFRNVPNIKFLNGSVHSFPEVVPQEHTLNKAPELNECIEHYPYSSIEDYLHRFNQYSSLEAQDMKDSLRVRKIDVIFRSLGMFSQSYFANKGYKDGLSGFVIAVIQMIYSFMLMIKIIEIKYLQHPNNITKQ